MVAKLKKSDMNPLGLEPYQGCAVTAVGIKISNAGGGLHDPLEVDEDMIEQVAHIMIGDSVYFLIRADCNGVAYVPVKGAEDRRRYIPSFHATDTTLVDDEWAIQKINEQRDKIQRLRDEAEGKLPMFDGAGNAIDHSQGLALVGDEGGQ
jgi:hypothetical protein